MGAKSRVVIAVVIVVVVAAAIWYLTRQPPEMRPKQVVSAPEQPAAPSQAEQQQAPAQPTAQPQQPPVVAPPESLDGSDSTVQSAAQDISPQLAEWMKPDQQIRKWVTTIANVADGKVVDKNRPLSFSVPKFKVDERDGKTYMSTENYQRAKPLVDTLTSIPPDKLAAYYRQWRPLLEKAYSELGKPGTFHNRLMNAIDEVLAVKPLDHSPELKQPSVYYVYADPKLEKASAIDKLMWRLGPDNTRELQQYLRKLQDVLMMPPPSQ